MFIYTIIHCLGEVGLYSPALRVDAAVAGSHQEEEKISVVVREISALMPTEDVDLGLWLIKCGKAHSNR